jgi:hypothetical protein
LPDLDPGGMGVPRCGRSRRSSVSSALLPCCLLVSLSAVDPRPALAQDPPPSSSSSPAKGGGEDSDDSSSWFSQTNVGYGPYHQGALGFFNSLRLGFIPRVPTFLPDGSFEARATESWAKDIALKDQSYNLDYEILRTQASIAYGISNQTLVELDFDTATRVHGILDPLMNGFHDTFAIPLGPRGRLPNNSFRIELEPGQGRPAINLDRDAGRPFTRAVILSVQHALTYGDDVLPAFAYSFSARPPLGRFEPLSGGSPIDLSGSLSASKSFGDFYLYLAADLSLFGDESYAGTPLRAYQWGGLGAVEWNCLPRFSVIVQCMSMSGAVNTFGRFSKPSYELCYGVKWEVARNFRLDLGMLHDVQNPINAPDFGFQLELCLRW